MPELPIPASELATMTICDIYWKGWWDGHNNRNEDEALVYEPRAFEKPPKYSGQLATKVRHLGLTPNTSSALIQSGVRSLGELIERTEDELLRMRRMGPKRLREVKERLAELDYALSVPPLSQR